MVVFELPRTAFGSTGGSYGDNNAIGDELDESFAEELDESFAEELDESFTEELDESIVEELDESIVVRKIGKVRQGLKLATLGHAGSFCLRKIPTFSVVLKNYRRYAVKSC